MLGPGASGVNASAAVCGPAHALFRSSWTSATPAAAPRC